jgi:hypothetical protein
MSLLLAVESPKSPLQADAAEDRGLYGPLQISQICLDDVNRLYPSEVEIIFGRPLVLKDCRSREASKWICRRYLGYWLRKYRERTGKEATLEVACRIWNGGPKGYARKSTDAYWKRVEAEMARR